MWRLVIPTLQIKWGTERLSNLPQLYFSFCWKISKVELAYPMKKGGASPDKWHPRELSPQAWNTDAILSGSLFTWCALFRAYCSLLTMFLDMLSLDLGHGGPALGPTPQVPYGESSSSFSKFSPGSWGWLGLAVPFYLAWGTFCVVPILPPGYSPLFTDEVQAISHSYILSNLPISFLPSYLSSLCYHALNGITKLNFWLFFNVSVPFSSPHICF